MLAVIEGVGYPNPNLSHFAAMDIWQTLDLNGQGGRAGSASTSPGWSIRTAIPSSRLPSARQLPVALQRLNADVPVVSSTRDLPAAA